MEVAEVMSRDVVTVEPAASLREVARLLTERRISGVPVVDGGTLVGVVSATDVVARGSAPATAAEAMTAPAVCIGPGRPIWEAADLMARKGVDRLAVVDGGGALAGIVTRADLVRAFGRSDEAVEQDLRVQLAGNGIDVEVAAGVTTLRGVVATRASAEAAVLIAARTPGVVTVVARLIYGGRPRRRLTHR